MISANRCDLVDGSFCTDQDGSPYCERDSPCMPCGDKQASYSRCSEEEKAVGFRCICPVGLKPPRCRERADPCGQHLCQNNARCQAMMGDGGEISLTAYRCWCTPGYGGDRCEHMIDVCE